MAPNKKTSGPKGPVEEKRTHADEGDAAAKLETAIRANGADVAKSIALINTGRIELEVFAFQRPHYAPIYGLGNATDAANYERLISHHASGYGMRRLTVDEAAQLRDRRLNVFTIADELAKFNHTRKAG